MPSQAEPGFFQSFFFILFAALLPIFLLGVCYLFGWGVRWLRPRPHAALWIGLIAACSYIAMAIYAIEERGKLGAPILYIATGVVWLVYTVWQYRARVVGKAK